MALCFREVLEDYEAAGLELDFMFDAFYFKVQEPRKAELMTAHVTAMRRLADEIGRKQHRTITLMARVALEPERNLGRGLDVEAWLRAGALDLVCGQDRAVLSDPGVQTPWLAETANECGAHAYYRPPRRVYDERVGLPSPDMCARDTARHSVDPLSPC